MRRAWWIGGVALASFFAFDGCSGDDTSEGSAGGDAAASEAGTGGRRLDAGGNPGNAETGVDANADAAPDGSIDTGVAESSTDGSATADGAADPGVRIDGSSGAGGGGSADAQASEGGTHATGDGGPGRGGSSGTGGVGGSVNSGVGGSAMADSGQPAGDADRPDAFVDAGTLGADATVPEDGSIPNCKLSSTGAGSCEAEVPLPKTAYPLGGGITVTACPDGTNSNDDICIGHGSFGDRTWRKSTLDGGTGDGKTWSGTVGLRIAHLPVEVNIGAGMTCDLAVGGTSFVDVPVQVTLPAGANAFVPGCTPVSTVDIVDLGKLTLTTSSECQQLVDLARGAGLLDTVSTNIQNVITQALQGQVCLNR